VQELVLRHVANIAGCGVGRELLGARGPKIGIFGWYYLQARSEFRHLDPERLAEKTPACSGTWCTTVSTVAEQLGRDPRPCPPSSQVVHEAADDLRVRTSRGLSGPKPS
jgi:hypothetical protein